MVWYAVWCGVECRVRPEYGGMVWHAGLDGPIEISYHLRSLSALSADFFSPYVRSICWRRNLSNVGRVFPFLSAFKSSRTFWNIMSAIVCTDCSTGIYSGFSPAFARRFTTAGALTPTAVGATDSL